MAELNRTPFGFKLDVLAFIASQERERLYHDVSTQVQENNLPVKPRRSRRKQSTPTTCLQGKNALGHALIAKYSICKADELNKKYSYKCNFLPGECDAEFKSYGNERKALDTMIVHLQNHKEKQEFEAQKPRYGTVILRTPPVDQEPECSSSHLTKSPKKGKTPCALVPEEIPSTSCSAKKLLFRPKPAQTKSVFAFLNDHIYANMNDRKIEKPQIVPSNIESTSSGIGDQFIIKTPRFPFVYCPFRYRLSQIDEVNADGKMAVHPPFGIGVYPYSFEGPVQEKTETKAVKRKRNPSDEKPSKVMKMNCTGSILECVENKVNMEELVHSMSKNVQSTSDMAEDSENIQQVEKQQALKLIAKLNSRKKKKANENLVCEICQDRKTFTALATLINHYRSHAGIKPYTCNICDSTFTRQFSLNYHKMIHKNMTRFTCEYCNRSFRHPSHYKEHLRRHTGETPFHCDDCGMNFKTRSTFKRHMKLRHKLVVSVQGPEEMGLEE